MGSTPNVLVLACCAALGFAEGCGDRTGLPVDRVDATANCPNAEEPIYLLTRQSDLYTFHPPTRASALVGRVSCPTRSRAFSMAVGRNGVAFALFDDGRLYRVDTATAGCTATSFAPGQHAFMWFGMAYVAEADASDRLLVADNNSTGLASIDTTSMTLQFIGPWQPQVIPSPELTGTGGAGRLFAFSPNPDGSGTHLFEVNKRTAEVISDAPLRVASPGGGAYAFAFWGGDFWIFTAPDVKSSLITRYRPRDTTETPMGTLPFAVVGAGVSTCAPE